jgi:hypothetical protein
LQQAYFYCLKLKKEAGTVLLIPTTFQNKTAIPGGYHFLVSEGLHIYFATILLNQNPYV